MQKIKWIQSIGLLLIVGALLMNPFFIQKLLDTFYARNPKYVLNSLFYVVLFVLELVVIYGGIYFVKKPQKALTLLPSLLLSFGVMLACIPLVALILNLSQPEELRGVTNSEFHHIYPSHASGFFYSSGKVEWGKISITTNELGMRGEEIPLVKDKKRILILGDSFIQAKGIPFDKTLGQILQRILQRSLNGDYLVLQQGFSSWSPLLELNFLVKTYDKVKPDKVFLVLYLNDFYDGRVYSSADEIYTQQAVFDDQGYPKYFNVKNSLTKQKWFGSNLKEVLYAMFHDKTCPLTITQEDIDYLVNLQNYTKEYGLEKLGGLEIIENSLRLARSPDTWDEKTQQRMDLSLHYIKKMHEFLRENNATLTVVLTPAGPNLARDENILGKQSGPYNCLHKDVLMPDQGIRDRLAAFASEEGINYVEIKPIMEKFKNKHPSLELFFQYDGHWNEQGHQLMAGILYLMISNDERKQS